MSVLRKESAINATLYVLNSLGKTDMHRLFKILYFADREHLGTYGRAITGDDYIAMNFGPVPSQIYDAIKAAQGKSFLSSAIDEAKAIFVPSGKYEIAPGRKPDMSYLSDTDVECLDNAIAFCRDKSFEELVNASHQYAWNNTMLGMEMTPSNILREAGCTEEMVQFFEEEERITQFMRNGFAR